MISTRLSTLRPPRRGRALAALSALIAVASLTLAASASHAQATQGKIHFEETFTETLTDFPCFEDVPVTITGTVVVTGHFVDVSDRHRSFHVTETIEYHVDIGDGRYATGGVVVQRTVTVNPRAPRTTATTTQKEQATVYDSEGRPVGQITLRITSHKTYADRNGDGFADPDELVVAVDRDRLACA